MVVLIKAVLVTMDDDEFKLQAVGSASSCSIFVIFILDFSAATFRVICDFEVFVIMQLIRL